MLAPIDQHDKPANLVGRWERLTIKFTLCGSLSAISYEPCNPLIALGRPQWPKVLISAVSSFEEGDKDCPLKMTGALTVAGYEIRDLHEADLADTADVWFRSWHAAFPDLSHPMPYKAWLPRLRDDIAAKCVCRVAILNAAVVGFVAVDVGKASLEQIFVAPEHQGMAIGKMLVGEAKRLCPSGLRLTTLQQNAEAATFYSRQGFKRGSTGTNPVNGLPNVEFVWRPSNHSRHA